jgi:Rrf2 family iron-sulfur cluster assembly transcriptional regulator
MRLTTKGGFALTAMIDVALRERDGPVPLASISRRQHIARSSLELLFSKLRRHALIKATRGPGGGYTLTRRACEITVADILASVDAPGPDRRRSPGRERRRRRSRLLFHRSPLGLRQAPRDGVPGLGHLQSLVDDQLAKGLRVDDEPVRKKAPPLRPSPACGM